MLIILWSRLKTACLHSLTIAWSYVLALVGAVLQLIDSLGDTLADQGIKDQIAAAIGDARTVGRVLLVISIVNIVARLRTLKKVS
jgi:hypothetical protein